MTGAGLAVIIDNENPGSNGVLQAALQLGEEFGLPVFPCKQDKSPLTKNGFHDACSNAQGVIDLFADCPDALLGVATGRVSGLLVIDVDPAGAVWYHENADRLACGRVHRTHRGHHLLFRMPAVDVRCSAGKIAPGVDVRADGGYVIWWPFHGLETVGSMEDVTEPPCWLLELLFDPPKLDTHQPDRSAEVSEGSRNEFLSREAFRLRKQGCTVEQIKNVISVVNSVRCCPPLPESEVHMVAVGKSTIEPESQASVGLVDFYAYMPAHQYIFTPTRELWPAASVNSRIPPMPTATGKAMQPSAWLDQNRPVEQMVWVPGRPKLIENALVSDGGWIVRAGSNTFNLYRPPEPISGDPMKAARWLEHVHRVFPTDASHIVRWLAHRVQRPGEKINHALVLGGGQGIGKDTLLEPVKLAVGAWNFSEISPGHLLGRFNGFVKSVVLRISEARDLGDIDRYGFYDHMKIYTAAPPDVLRCDEKNLREHAVLNVTGVLITSNHKSDGIFLPADDRRHYIAWSDCTKDQFAEDYWRDLYRWYAAGGARHVAAYLAEFDLTDFDPKAPPQKTPAFWDIVDASRAPEDSELADVLDALQSPPVVTVSALCIYASDPFREWLQDRRNSRQIPHRLEACGYTAVRNDADRHNGQWKVDGKRQVIYAKKELALRDRIAAAGTLCRAGR